MGEPAFEGLFDPAGLSGPWEAGLEGTFPLCAPLSTSCEGDLEPAGEEPAGEELPSEGPAGIG